MPGPFHRLENQTTQTPAIARLQGSSNEIWGKAASNTAQSNLPSVKAYRNSLPTGQRGVEFETPVQPTSGRGSLYEIRWYDGTSGVLQRVDAAGTDHAAIPLSSFINGQP